MNNQFPVDSAIISYNEIINDGKTIYLYYNKLIGLYVAFGFSSFLVTHLIEPVCSYSEDFQMPIALVTKGQIVDMRRSLNTIKHEPKFSYQLELRNEIGTEGYDKWANALKMSV